MSEQWFVVNVGDAEWESKGQFGVRCRFESPDARFPHFGITVQVLQPGQPSGLYHAEDAQEGFLVLAVARRLLREASTVRFRARLIGRHRISPIGPPRPPQTRGRHLVQPSVATGSTPVRCRETAASGS